MKILILDIETAPGEKYYWDLYNDSPAIDMIIRPPRLLCWAAKWHGDRAVEFRSEWEDGTEAMVSRAGELFDEADAIVHYYGKHFDVPHINREILLAGLPQPSPHKDIDLKEVVRKRFKFSSNKLDHVAQQLGVGNKVEHEGFKLWRKIVDPTVDEATRRAARARMRRYNIGDVRLEERVYDKVRGWIQQHPNVALFDDIPGGCPNCGGITFNKNGFAYTGVSKFQRYRCQTCGHPVRGKKAITTSELRSAA